MLKLSALFTLLVLGSSIAAQAEVCGWNGRQNLSCQSDFTYQVDQNYDANYCEFYVNSFGYGEWAHNGPTLNWIDSYVMVDINSLEKSQGGKVLNVGMWTAGNFFNGNPVPNEPGYYHVGMTYVQTGTGAFPSDAKHLGEFAYYIDIKRASGETDRLWYKSGPTNFDLGQVTTNYPTSIQSLGAGRIVWIEGYSPIFAAKRRCSK